jgi:cytidine diphosphoramidate kinase
MVIWLTGKSGAGKSTLTALLYQKFLEKKIAAVYLDGDVIREVISDGLGYKIEDRVKQISRIQKLALMLESQNLVVIVAALYANHELLEWNRNNFKNYFEIYLQIDFDKLLKRDPKGLYKKVAEGKIKDFVGHDIPWIPPFAPDLVLDMDLEPTRDECINKIHEELERKNVY